MLNINKANISFELVPYKFDVYGTRITVFKDVEKNKMLEYIDGLSKIIKNPEQLKLYFKGWSINHIWIPKLPENIENLENYMSAENYDLLKCEAHLSQAKEIFEILFQDEVHEAMVMSDAIINLQRMPV